MVACPGDDCSVPLFKGFWREVESVGGAETHQPITSHTAVVMYNQLWVVCGYSFAEAHSCSNLARYGALLLIKQIT